MAKEKGSKQLILEFLLANVGRKIESKELQEASGWKAEWARRVRELRDEEGYQFCVRRLPTEAYINCIGV